MTDVSPQLWSKNFILVSAINLCLVLVFYLLVIVIVGYAVHELHVSIAQAGLVSGLFIVGALLGRFIVGKLMQRWGAKTCLYFGLTGFFLTSLLYFIPLGIESLLLVRLTHGMMMGIASSVLGTVIAQIIPAQRRGEGIGYYSMSSTLGTAIGPFLAIWLTQQVSYAVIY